jgi:hypothetical protein
MSGTEDAMETRIRDRAYQLWEQEGRPEGRAEEFWHRARADVSAVDTAGAEPSPQDVAGETGAASLAVEGMSRH